MKRIKFFPIVALVVSLACVTLFATPTNSQTGPAPGAQPTPAPAPAPAPAPQPAPPTLLPMPQPSPAPVPQPPTAAQNPLSLQQVIWIEDGLARLAAAREQLNPSIASKIRAVAAKHPDLSLGLLLRGLIGIFGLPIHTMLEGFLKRRGISPEAASAEFGAVGKQFDWIVNLLTSVKPSLISKAASLTKVSIIPAAAQIKS